MMTIRSTAVPLDAVMTVNDVMSRWPATMRVLNALGVDTCCGSGDTLRQAAERAGVALPVLLAAVEHAAHEGS